MPPPKLANSINGYVAKLLFRRAKRTLLVEGDSDRVILSALVIRVKPNPGRLPVLIDSADTIKGTGMGNREIVEAVHLEAKAQGVTGYACLVDREFRGFFCDVPCRDDLAAHAVHDDVMFWTRGHSVENYLFVIESVIRYLEVNHASAIPPRYREIVEGGYKSILSQAVAFSLAALASKLIQRSDRIVTLSDWSTDAAGQPILNIKQIGVALLRRAAPSTSVAQLETLFENHRVAAAEYPPALLRWISHGHLGGHIIWTGIGYLMSGHIADVDTVDQLCRGQNHTKCGIGADLWGTRSAL